VVSPVVTATLADADADPPFPVHVRVYVEFAVGETFSEPLTVSAPLQLPDAEQLVALVELHVSVEDWPAVIDVGEAVRVTVVWVAVAVTLTDADADPPFPVHVRVYVEFTAGETVSEPLTVSAPLQLPDAEQLVALVELHVSVEDWPAVIDVGEAVRVTVGVGAVVTVTVADAVLDPPAPVQVSV
jgi:hypothetical protein